MNSGSHLPVVTGVEGNPGSRCSGKSSDVWLVERCDCPPAARVPDPKRLGPRSGRTEGECVLRAALTSAGRCGEFGGCQPRLSQFDPPRPRSRPLRMQRQRTLARDHWEDGNSGPQSRPFRMRSQSHRCIEQTVLTAISTALSHCPFGAVTGMSITDFHSGPPHGMPRPLRMNIPSSSGTVRGCCRMTRYFQSSRTVPNRSPGRLGSGTHLWVYSRTVPGRTLPRRGPIISLYM